MPDLIRLANKAPPIIDNNWQQTTHKQGTNIVVVPSIMNDKKEITKFQLHAQMTKWEGIKMIQLMMWEEYL